MKSIIKSECKLFQRCSPPQRDAYPIGTSVVRMFSHFFEARHDARGLKFKVRNYFARRLNLTFSASFVLSSTPSDFTLPIPLYFL